MPQKVKDPRIAEIRQEAKQHAEQMRVYSRLANGFYEVGNESSACFYSNEVRRLQIQLNEANRVASEKIFKHVNKGRPHHEIDLHGLYVKEAIIILEVKLVEARRKGLRGLNVIVGRGLHSEFGPKIKPAVIKYANTNKLTYSISKFNEGCIHFSLEATPKLSPLDFRLHELDRPLPRYDILEPQSRKDISYRLQRQQQSTMEWFWIVVIAAAVLILILIIATLTR